MSSDHAAVAPAPKTLDYSLTGRTASEAIERGLAEADWYQTPVPREAMRKLLERRDGPAVRDTIVWFGLIFGSGYATYLLWPTWWAAIPYLVYAVLYGTTSDSRWHEAGHGTAFRTDWMNNALYEIASFMVMREATVWRWSHTRHHSDTIIVGRDPEIHVPRPPNLKRMALNFLNIPAYQYYFKQVLNHSLGRMLPEEKTFVPESEYAKIFRKARIHVGIYAGVVGISYSTGSVLPLMFVGFANFFGSWLMYVYGLTQHAGLAENVLDHRLNCRTVHMNRIHRFLYWNMNYHVEHHMFPLVPYHGLPQLHELVKHDMPVPYPGIAAAFREIIPTVLRQVKDPAYHVKRRLPEPGTPGRNGDNLKTGDAPPDADGWIEVCAAADLRREDVIRFDHGKKTFALYRAGDGRLFATDGICTHGNTHLADGLVKGTIVECPKHNGRFNLTDGSPARPPVCRGLATYPLEELGGRLRLNVARSGGSGARRQRRIHLQLKSARMVATFIRELEFEPVDDTRIDFTPGDYLQFDIPEYGEIPFTGFGIPEPYASVWRRQHVFELVARHDGRARRNNYSIASNPKLERRLRFNVRIATPPPGQDCATGVGSAYMFNLKPGDTVSAIGPFGDFHLKPTQKEIVYIGGGAGMAPLRAHLSHLFESQRTARKVTFWYGARSRQEIFYEDYFNRLAGEFSNFSFNLALSAPLPEDAWAGHTGMIHETVYENHLKNHPNPKAVEFYLCGPPMMIRACTRMLAECGVATSQISFDEF